MVFSLINFAINSVFNAFYLDRTVGQQEAKWVRDADKLNEILGLPPNSPQEDVKSQSLVLKGHLLWKTHFYMFGHKCVLAVCEHNHPTLIKIHPLLIFFIQSSLNRHAVLILKAI